MIELFPGLFGSSVKKGRQCISASLFQYFFDFFAFQVKELGQPYFVKFKKHIAGFGDSKRIFICLRESPGKG